MQNTNKENNILDNTEEVRVPEVVDQELDNDEIYEEVDKMFCEVLTKLFTMILDDTIEDHPMTGNHEVDATQTWPEIVADYKERVKGFRKFYNNFNVEATR